MRPVVSRAAAALLGALAAWSLATALAVRNPDPDLVPYFARLAPHLPEGELGFVTGPGPRRATLYRYDAMRYALAPRPVAWERPPTREWLIADRAGVPPGYEVVHAFGDGLALLRRR
jgi:hypothetical protein